MDKTTLIFAILFLIGAVYLLNYEQKLKNKIDLAKKIIDGKLLSYKRRGKYLFPIIEFTENNQVKTIEKHGITNLKPIKVGEKVRVVPLEKNKYLTDCDIKTVRYYIYTCLIGFVMFMFISLTI